MIRLSISYPNGDGAFALDAPLRKAVGAREVDSGQGCDGMRDMGWLMESWVSVRRSEANVLTSFGHLGLKITSREVQP